MFQFLLKLLRKATCDAILGGVDDAMDQLGEINDGSERTTTLRDRVLALTAKGAVVEAEAGPAVATVEAKGKRVKS